VSCERTTHRPLAPGLAVEGWTWRFSLPIGDGAATIQAAVAAPSIAHAIMHANDEAAYAVEVLDTHEAAAGIHPGGRPLFLLDDLVEIDCRRCGHRVALTDRDVEAGHGRRPSVALINALTRLCKENEHDH
jgi:hypothetical protein